VASKYLENFVYLYPVTICQLKRLCEFLNYLSGEVDGSVLVGYCISVLDDWRWTFRDSMMLPKRRELITHWCGCLYLEIGDLKVRC